MQISCTVTAQLISAFVVITQIVQPLYFLYPKFQASSHLLWLYSRVCVGPGQKAENRFSRDMTKADYVRLTILYDECFRTKHSNVMLPILMWLVLEA